MYLCIYISIYLYIYTSIHLYIYTSIHLYIYTIYTSIHLYIYTSIYLYIYISIYLYMYRCIHVYVYTCIPSYPHHILNQMPPFFNHVLPLNKHFHCISHYIAKSTLYNGYFHYTWWFCGPTLVILLTIFCYPFIVISLHFRFIFYSYSTYNIKIAISSGL